MSADIEINLHVKCEECTQDLTVKDCKYDRYGDYYVIVEVCPTCIERAKAQP